MDKRAQPRKQEGNKFVAELRFHRKPSPSNTPRKVIKPQAPQVKQEPSDVKSDSSGYSHLAGDVDRWIHGSGTNVANVAPVADGGPVVASNVVAVPAVPSNATLRAPEPVVTSTAVQSSRHQQQRTTMISGVHLGRSPCFTLGWLLMNIETGFGARSAAAISSIMRFLASQVHQVCMGCVLDGRRALQLGLPSGTLAARACAFAMDALLVAYVVGLAALAVFQINARVD